MQKKENIVRYTAEELRAQIAKEGHGFTEKFYTMTQKEAERLADEEDAEFAREDAARGVRVHLEPDLMNYITTHHLNLDQSINTALRQHLGI
jgi:hypothetical protein